MNLDNYVVISGLPGVHKLVTSRSNGLIIEDKVENRTRFVPVRTSQLTPLATIGIYTETEEGTVALATVFRKMYDQREMTPVVSPDAGSANLRTYFTTILPEHDQYRPPHKALGAIHGWHATALEVLWGADHACMGRTDRIAEAVVAFCRSQA